MENVVSKSHEADKAVLTEFGRMGPAKLREECKNRGLSMSRSKNWMVSYLACAMAFTRGRNVGLSERPLEDIKPKDEEKKCDEKEGYAPDCARCGERMSPFGMPGMFVCFSGACLKNMKCSGGNGASGGSESESSDELFKKYTDALRREYKLRGKVGIVMRCSFPENISPVELQKLSDRIAKAVYETVIPGPYSHTLVPCCGHRGAVKIHEVDDDRDDKADAMRYGAPQPFTVHLESKNGKLPPMLLGYVHPKRPWHRFTNNVAEIVFKIRLFLWAKSVMRAHKKSLRQKENDTI